MRLKELQLLTGNLAELQLFYSTVLQLPVHKLTSNSIAISTGKSKIVFTESSVASNANYHFAINIPSNKIEAALLWLKNKTQLVYLHDYKSYIADFTDWNAKSVYFIDPSENIVELIARFDLEDNINEEFSSAHFRCVSEIGIVYPAETFDESIEKLLQETKLTYFKKQPPMPQFRAIGDDNGLLIAVPENRTWYGSAGRRAGIFPMEITFTSNDIEQKISL